jgi:alcohol dehydrogenase (cytochrome c)
MGKRAISAAVFALAAGISTASGLAQEVKQDAKSTANQAKISPVTQDQLNAAAKNAAIFC